MKNYLSRFGLLIGILCAGMACDNPAVIPPADLPFEGSGSFTYSGYAPLQAKPVRVYYHVPPEPGSQTPIVFVFHGADRNGAAYRNAWVAKAEEYGFMVFVPEFSDTYYPGGDAYNLGNVFVDGDNPSPATLNEESVWTFSIVEPLFDFVKAQMANQTATYDLYGHSAGAQFVHRFMMFKPEARLGTLISASAGWYTVPDKAIDFPYGIRESPVELADLSVLFSKKLIIQIGSLDNDPNAPGLRHNDIVDLQGTHRLARAQHFYQQGQQVAASLGTPFPWQFMLLPNVGHDFEATSQAAADLLFQ